MPSSQRSSTTDAAAPARAAALALFAVALLAGALAAPLAAEMVTVPAAAFVALAPETSALVYSVTQGNVTTADAGGEAISAAAHPAEGAFVLGLVAHFRDTSAAHDGGAKWMRRVAAGGWVELAQVVTSGSSPSVQTVSVALTTGRRVRNANFSYWIWAGVAAGIELYAVQLETALFGDDFESGDFGYWE